MDEEIYGGAFDRCAAAGPPRQSGFRPDQLAEHGVCPRLKSRGISPNRANPQAASELPCGIVSGLFTFRWHRCAAEGKVGGWGKRFASSVSIRGFRRTGWGIVESLGNSLRFVGSGTVRSDDKAALATRLCQLHDGLAEVAARGHAARGRGRADLRQQGCGGDAEARPGARHRHAGAGARRPGRRRICAQRRQEGGDRRRPWRQEADPHDGEGADAEGRLSTATTPPTRWPSPSATRITGRASPTGWRRWHRERTSHDRQAQGHAGRDRRGFLPRRRAWRRLRRLLLGAHACRAAGRPARRWCCSSRPMCART